MSGASLGSMMFIGHHFDDDQGGYQPTQGDSWVVELLESENKAFSTILVVLGLAIALFAAFMGSVIG